MIKKEILDLYISVIKTNKLFFVFIILSGIIFGLSGVFIPLLLKLETDQLVQKNTTHIFGYNFGSFETFLLILVFIFIIMLLKNFFTSFINTFTRNKQLIIRNQFQFQLFEKMKNMEIGKTINPRYDYLSNVIRDHLWGIANYMTIFPQNFIKFIISFLGISILYIYFDYRLLFIVLISSFLIYYLDNYFLKISKQHETSWRLGAGRQLNKYANLFTYHFPNLGSAGGLETFFIKYKYYTEKEYLDYAEKNIKVLFFDFYRSFVASIRDILIKAIVGYGVFVGTNSIGMVVFTVSSISVLSDIFGNLFSFLNKYKEFKFEQETILLMYNMVKSVGEEEFKNSSINSISIKNIYFSYPNLSSYEKDYIEILKNSILGKNYNAGGNIQLNNNLKRLLESLNQDSKHIVKNIFSNLSITFEKGKIYGIVGKNGAGKTTLMYLLAGFFREYNGEILFGSENIKYIKNKDILEKISFLTQNPFIIGWAGSIRENLFLGVDEKNISEEKAFEYLEKFGLAKKIKENAKGLDAEIGNDIGFSGGEEQIISIIRILLQDREVIIMDEGTNQLDAENEVLVMSELLKHKQDKIIIFITHRMSTISKADEIYCLENGAFSQTGSHKELLAEGKNAYARFYKAQVLNE